MFEFPIPFVSFERDGAELEPEPSLRRGAFALMDAARYASH